MSAQNHYAHSQGMVVLSCGGTMPTKPGARCPRCKQIHPGVGVCARCRAAADQRGSAAARGYGRRHREVFREGVLERDRCCALCGAPATVADHWPLSRRQLIAKGFDPDDPNHGRGLCEPCHNHATGTTPGQEGGTRAR